MSADYIIVTDTTADLPESFVSEHNIGIVSISFSVDERRYKNTPDDTMSAKELYDLMRAGKMPKTQQANPYDVAEVYEKILSQGHDVLHICFSSALSGTYSSAAAAADEMREKYPERKVIVVDSLCASLGQGLLVYYVTRKKAEGASIDEAAAWAENNKLSICHWFTVDDLNHLFRGGRVSRAQAILGTMLGVKPVLHVDNHGKLVSVSKERGRQRSILALAERLGDKAINPKEQKIFISHGDCEKDAEYLASVIKERYGVADILINTIGPTIGAHSGPGTLAVFFIGTER